MTPPTIYFVDNGDHTLEILGMHCNFESQSVASKTADYLRAIAAEEKLLRERRYCENSVMPAFTWTINPVIGSENAFELSNGVDKSIIWHKGQNWWELQSKISFALERIRNI